MNTKDIMKLAAAGHGDLFQNLQNLDVLAPVASAVEQGLYQMDLERNKLISKCRRHPKRPWINPMTDPERLCNKWLGIYFNHYKIIPKGCRHCFKVVVKLDTLKQLFRLTEIQEGMGIPCKCGMERRSNSVTPNSYLAFWYAPLNGGLRGGRQLYKHVKEHLEKELGEGFSIYLKRGCTEMQESIPSDQWDSGADLFDHVEEMLEAVWDVEIPPVHELTMQKIHTMNLWISWSAERCEDYLEYTGGKRFNVEQTHYEDSIHSEKDFPGLAAKPNLEI